jgi:HEPN domain-containing protein
LLLSVSTLSNVWKSNIKALLVSLTIDFPKIHDIGELTQLLPQGQSISLDESQQELLTDYAVVHRYPGNWEPLTRTDAEEAITLAKQVRENIRVLLPNGCLGSTLP